MVVDSLLGNWEIDEEGNISEVPFPEHEPMKTDIKRNQYTLFIYFRGLFNKKISKIEISILNSKPRNREAEKNLLKHVRSAIQTKVDNEIIDNSGGIDNLLNKLKWNEWW